MKAELVLDALMMAITRRRPPKGIIFHSDRGSQYCSRRVRRRLAIFEYIEVFHNRQRLHSGMGYLTPVEFEHFAVKKAA